MIAANRPPKYFGGLVRAADEIVITNMDEDGRVWEEYRFSDKVLLSRLADILRVASYKPSAHGLGDPSQEIRIYRMHEQVLKLSTADSILRADGKEIAGDIIAEKKTSDAIKALTIDIYQDWLEKTNAAAELAAKRIPKYLGDLVRAADEVVIADYHDRGLEEEFRFRDFVWLSRLADILGDASYKPSLHGFWISNREIRIYRLHQQVLKISTWDTNLRATNGKGIEADFIVERKTTDAITALAREVKPPPTRETSSEIVPLGAGAPAAPTAPAVHR